MNTDSQTQNYHSRQMDRQERRGEKPPTYDERVAFAKILKRYEGEKQIAYWKRQKALLNYPNKKDLVAQFFQQEKQAQKLKDNKNSEQRKEQIAALEQQFREMQQASVYAKHSSKNK